MNLTKHWKPDEIEIIERFREKCVRCRRPFVILHEIVPRSKLPKTWKKEGNRVPLCNGCHNWAHKVGTSNSERILRECVEKRLDEYSRTK
jgi:5-methylcytosine-specific restriction endonuclease McrA